MSNYNDAYAVAFDATLAAELAALFSDDMGGPLWTGRYDEVSGQVSADSDTIDEALDAAERDIKRMTPEAIGALVTKRLTEQRAKHQAFLAKNGLDFGSMARAIVGAGK